MTDIISIILPAKDAEPFLYETLESIRNQSINNWECICVDDNSSDSTLDILNEFQKSDNRFRTYSNQGSGVISALQCGYDESIGKLITRMDADDIMPIDKLEKLSKVIVESGQGHIATGKVKYFNTTGEGFLNYQNWLNQMIDDNSHWSNLYKECVIASPNWMMFRDDFEKIGAFNSDIYPEDYELIFRCYRSGLNVASTDCITHLWRDHEARASRVSDLYKDNTFIPLKVNCFLELTRDSSRDLVVWGAGRKGKSIAKLLVDANESFFWLTNNLNKIDHNIYGIKLMSDENEFESSQWILAVSQPEQLDKKEQELRAQGLVLGKDYFVLV